MQCKYCDLIAENGLTLYILTLASLELPRNLIGTFDASMWHG